MIQDIYSVMLGLLSFGITCLVLVLVFVAVVRAIRSFFRRRMPKRLFLELDLNQPLVEVDGGDPFVRVLRPGSLTLREVLEALERARNDSRVVGVILNCSGAAVGLAQAQELRDALRAFAARGKQVVAYTDTFGEGGSGWIPYYIATAAERIYLQPSGDVNLAGLMTEQPFLMELLDRLGVEVRFQQRHEYKSVVELFTRRDMSEHAKETLQRVLDDMLSELCLAIEENRKIADAKSLIGEGPFMARPALARGLVDVLAYRDEVYSALRERHGKKLAFRFVSHYFERTRSVYRRGPVLAVVTGDGDIVRGQTQFNPRTRSSSMGSDTVAAALRAAAEDNAVKGILFRVNSRGGSYVASDTMWREVKRARDSGKPVVVWMGDFAASGGYFVSAPANAIVAQPLTLTGSIGVAGGKFLVRKLWPKVGMGFDGVQTHDNAKYFSANHDYDDQGQAAANTGMDRAYDDFTSKVREGRGLNDTQIDAVARGRVWSGRRAHENGLVDELGGFETALARLKKEAGIEGAVCLREFPRTKSLWEQIVRSGAKSSEDLGVASWRRTLGLILEGFGWLMVLPRLLTRGRGVQLRDERVNWINGSR